MVASPETTPQGHRATLSLCAPKAAFRASGYVSSDSQSTVDCVKPGGPRAVISGPATRPARPQFTAVSLCTEGGRTCFETRLK